MDEGAGVREYGLAIERTHSDPDWRPDPDNPLVWAPPFPEHRMSEVRQALDELFHRAQADCEPLAAVDGYEFMTGPVDFDTAGRQPYERVTSWKYRFGWYVAIEEPA